MEKRFNLRQRLLLALAPPLASLLLRLWALSWRVSVKALPGLDPRHGAEPCVFAYWHEGVMTTILNWRGTRIQGLASKSFDGELITRLMRWLGYPPLARGSSSRGGEGGLMAQVSALEQGLHAGISVDGPKGPAYEPKPGAVALAAISKRAVVGVASACSPDWRLRNWDRTQVPPPFARLAFVFTEPLLVRPGEEEGARLELKKRLNQARAEAEQLLNRK